MTTDPAGDALARLWHLAVTAPWPAVGRFAEAMIARGLYPTTADPSPDDMMAAAFADPGAFAAVFRETILPDLAGQARADALAAIRVIDSTALPGETDRPQPGEAAAAEVTAAGAPVKHEQFAALAALLELVGPYAISGSDEPLRATIARMPEIEQITAWELADKADDLIAPRLQPGGNPPPGADEDKPDDDGGIQG